MNTQMGEVRRVTQMCTDASSEARNNATTAEFLKTSCGKVAERMDGCKVISDMDCDIVGKQANGYGVTTFDRENAYLTEGTSTQGVTRIDGKWWGRACWDERLAPIRLR